MFLDWLRRDGTRWSSHPTREEVMREYERIWALLGRRTIEELIDLPLITDPDVLDTLDVFTEIMTPSQLFDENLNSLVICRLVTLSLEHGNCDASCFAYVWLAMFAGPRFNNYKDGFRFGQLGYDLVEKRGLTRYQARIWMNMGSTVLPWAKHVAGGRELVRRAFDAAYRIGDLTFASYSWILHGLPRRRGSTRGSAKGMRERPGICQAGAFRPGHRALRSTTRFDPHLARADCDVRVPGS